MRLVSATAGCAALLFSAAEASRLTPPVLPLVVRNPYLSTWLQNARDEPWSEWPMFWTGEHVGLSILARSPSEGIVYPLLGRPQDSLHSDDPGYDVSTTEYLGAQYDASTTNLSYAIHHAQDGSSKTNVLVSFFSPITPTSTLRQSIPASYLTIYVSGKTDLDVYVDLNGQWVSGDRGNKIVWDFEQSSLDGSHLGLKTWSFKRETEQYFTEVRDQAEWGTLYFSAPSSGVRHESGTSSLLRQRFARTGTLQNQNDPDFRPIMDEEPVFAFAKSFRANDTVKGKSQSLRFTIAHVQDPIIQFAAARGLTLMRPLWKSYFTDVSDLLAFHYRDFEAATVLAGKYSTKLAADAGRVGAQDHADVVALAARQVMGATHFVGTPEDPLLFLKEISSDGNTQTIDVIFPAAPFFLYTNPRWLAYMLEPDIEHMLSGQYPNKYAMHDLGSHYPNATGYPEGRDEYMPVEECGNILILGLAVANSIKYGANTSIDSDWKPMAKLPASAASDAKFFPLTVGEESGVQYIDDAWLGGPLSVKQAEKWVQHSYKLWIQWTQYLVEYSLEPENQLSTDDFAGWLALQTNLALKGIIGIKAMAGLAEIVGNKGDVKKYNNISRTYIGKWEEYGISRDKTHAKLAYNWFGSWTTLYNLYADSLLCFHLGDEDNTSTGQVDSHQPELQEFLSNPKDDKSGFVPKHIYQLSSDWYYAVRQKYGVPLDSRHLYAKSDWVSWAMSVAAPKVRDQVMGSLARWVNETSTNRPMTDLHNTEGDGGFPGPDFFARPVVGGHFAYLSLEKACGGRALEGLKFLNDDVTTKSDLDVHALLQNEDREAELRHAQLSTEEDL